MTFGNQFCLDSFTTVGADGNPATMTGAEMHAEMRKQAGDQNIDASTPDGDPPLIAKDPSIAEVLNRDISPGSRLHTIAREKLPAAIARCAAPGYKHTLFYHGDGIWGCEDLPHYILAGIVCIPVTDDVASQLLEEVQRYDYGWQGGYAAAQCSTVLSIAAARCDDTLAPEVKVEWERQIKQSAAFSRQVRVGERASDFVATNHIVNVTSSLFSIDKYSCSWNRGAPEPLRRPRPQQAGRLGRLG